MEYTALNNGIKMPMAGLGTFQLSPDEAENSVLHALESGYNLIDTANAYMNERGVGRGIRRSGVKREDIFLVTKLWPTEYADGAKAIDDTLERLGTDYLDLLLLHQPVGDWIAGYKAMEEALEAGKIRALGLSNFTEENIREVMEKCSVVPQVVQVEAHPYYPQTSLKAFMSERGMRLMAWYPLGHGDRSLLDEPVFARLAAKYGKNSAQVILRWHVQSGNIVIPGSRSPEHIKSNLNIFDFALSGDEMAEIAALDSGTRYYNVDPRQAARMYLSMNLDFNSQK